MKGIRCVHSFDEIDRVTFDFIICPECNSPHIITCTMNMNSSAQFTSFSEPTVHTHVHCTHKHAPFTVNIRSMSTMNFARFIVILHIILPCIQSFGFLVLQTLDFTHEHTTQSSWRVWRFLYTGLALINRQFISTFF